MWALIIVTWITLRQHKKIEENKKILVCGERGSNTRPSDLQSDALPTELSPLNDNFTVLIYLFAETIVTVDKASELLHNRV